MPTALATFLIGLAGDKQATQLHQEAIAVATATTITGGTVGTMSVYQPWTNADVVTAIKWHPLAVSTSMQVDVVPGPGTFGRAVMLHMAWADDSVIAPTTVGALAKMHGYRVHTYGGAADPGEADRKFVAPYNEARTDVLKARYFPIGGRIVLYYFFTEANFGTVQVAGDRFTFQVNHEFDLYGRN